MKQHTVTNFVAKYLLNCENLNISAYEIKQEFSNEDPDRDRELILENTKKIHNSNKERLD